MTNVVELSKDLPAKSPEIKEVLGGVLPFENAVNWIAFGNFSFKSFDWPLHLIHLVDHSTGVLIESIDRNEGRRQMAYQQLANSIGRGMITAYGHHYEPEEGEEADPRADDVLSDGRTRKILAVEAQEVFINLGGEDDCIAIGRHIYDNVFVSWSDLLKVFGPITLEYGDHLLGENKPLNVASKLIETNPSISSRGRPTKFSWEKLLQEIVILATSKGLPKTQAELERWAAEKCEELFGQEPAISSIRSKIAPVYARLRQNS